MNMIGRHVYVRYTNQPWIKSKVSGAGEEDDDDDDDDEEEEEEEEEEAFWGDGWYGIGAASRQSNSSRHQNAGV